MRELFWYLGSLVVVVGLYTIFYVLPRLSKLGSVVEGGGNSHAQAAIEALTTMGWNKDVATDKVSIAIQQCPEGDLNELINIAIRLP